MSAQLQQLFDYERPPFRRGSRTSKEAAAGAASKAPTKRETILALLRRETLTDEQIAMKLGMRENTVRPRRVELQRDKLIVAAGVATNSSGYHAQLWKAA